MQRCILPVPRSRISIDSRVTTACVTALRDGGQKNFRQRLDHKGRKEKKERWLEASARRNRERHRRNLPPATDRVKQEKRKDDETRERKGERETRREREANLVSESGHAHCYALILEPALCRFVQRSYWRIPRIRTLSFPSPFCARRERERERERDDEGEKRKRTGQDRKGLADLADEQLGIYGCVEAV